jgi:hypothetical protein
VLDDEIGATLGDQGPQLRHDIDDGGIPRGHDRRQADVGPDRWIAHRRSVDCVPMRHVIGRRALEVDVG